MDHRLDLILSILVRYGSSLVGYVFVFARCRYSIPAVVAAREPSSLWPTNAGRSDLNLPAVIIVAIVTILLVSHSRIGKCEHGLCL